MDTEFKKKHKSNMAVIPRSVMVIFCYIVPALLVAALIVSGVWGNGNLVRAEALRRTNEDIYTQAYTELADSVYNMHISLSKLMVSEAPSTLAETLNDIRHESGVIAGLMGRIPQSHVDSYELNRFLIQIGDYANQLSSALIRGGSLSTDDRGQLMEVYTASEYVYNELSQKLASGDIPLSALDSSGFFASQAAGNGNASGNGNAGGNSAQDAAASRYPTLIYDGPFSESTEKRAPVGIFGDDTDPSEAVTRARRYLGDEGAKLEYGGISYGKLPFHGFWGTLSNGNAAEIAISVRGGQLLYMREVQAAGGSARENRNSPDRANSAVNGSENADGNGGENAAENGGEYADRNGGEDENGNENGAGIPNEAELEELKKAGKEWLSSMGYGEMESTYAQYYGSSVLISFAAVQTGEFSVEGSDISELISADTDVEDVLNMVREGNAETLRLPVVLYNDLVKLRLDRAARRVIGADAENYLFSHTERELSGSILSSSGAKRGLYPNLVIEKTALALIPLPDQSERLCYEFSGSFAGAEYIVYMDAETGDEVRIFRLINSDDGTSAL